MLGCWKLLKLLIMVQQHSRLLLNFLVRRRKETLRHLQHRRVVRATRNIRSTKNQASTVKSRARNVIDQGLVTMTKKSANLISLIAIQLNQSHQCEALNRGDAREVVVGLVIDDTVGISSSFLLFSRSHL